MPDGTGAGGVTVARAVWPVLLLCCAGWLHPAVRTRAAVTSRMSRNSLDLMDGLSRQYPIKRYRSDTGVKALSFIRDNNSGMSLNYRLPVLFGIILIALLITAGCSQSSPAQAQVQTPVATTTAAVKETVTTVATPGILRDATKEEMVAFVQEAVAYAKQNGKEKALAEFSNRNGSFFRGVLYIYAYDYNGTTIAHPVNPEKIGVNRLQEPDAEGTWFITNLREAAYNGTGFSTYTYINPVHNNTVEKKLGYVMKVDDRWWLGSGIYSGPANTTGSK
jgi:hypothetical protein